MHVRPRFSDRRPGTDVSVASTLAGFFCLLPVTVPGGQLLLDVTLFRKLVK